MKLVKATATLISTVIMLAIVITTPVALAQEEDDDLEPSVDTSAMLDLSLIHISEPTRRS